MNALTDRLMPRLDHLRAHRFALIAYLRAKVDIEDWHGVADAACDLREIDAEIRGMAVTLGERKT